jgi:hypothetical protein
MSVLLPHLRLDQLLFGLGVVLHWQHARALIKGITH